MSKFRDKLGREWLLDITMGSAAQVEDDTTPRDADGKATGPGIDLLKWIEDQAGSDNKTVFRIVGSLAADQIAAAGLTLRQFGDGFDGAALERAGVALVEALLFFSRPRKVALAAAPKMRAVMEQVWERAAREIERQDFSSLDGDLPASAASTPGP